MMELRLISIADASTTLEVYRPYVTDTAVSFEYEVPTLQEFQDRIRFVTCKYPWLVLVDNDVVAGYAYASEFRHRAAYQWSVESGIYLSEHIQGRGLGKLLYQSLFGLLRLQGYYNLYAGLALPNEASERLHVSCGFSLVGCFQNIGYKAGKWHTTKWFQLPLLPHSPNPAPPLPITEIEGTASFKELISLANQQLIHLQNQ